MPSTGVAIALIAALMGLIAGLALWRTKSREPLQRSKGDDRPWDRAARARASSLPSPLDLSHPEPAAAPAARVRSQPSLASKAARPSNHGARAVPGRLPAAGARALPKAALPSDRELSNLLEEEDDDTDLTIVTLGPLAMAQQAPLRPSANAPASPASPAMFAAPVAQEASPRPAPARRPPREPPPRLVSLADRDFELVEDEEGARPSAVPIVYDEDAALDEPTAVGALILVSAAGQTDRGQRRRKNEDSYAILDEHGIFVVADGMGGHRGGEVASKIAVDVITTAFREGRFPGDLYPGVPRRGAELAVAIQQANQAIYERSRSERELAGMGTTVVSARFSPNKERVYLGHVGDSRGYRLRNRELRQITTDHTMGAVGLVGPLADRLERAVGIGPAVKVDVIITRPRPEDVYMLCSDGLTKMVPEAAIRDVLLGEGKLEQAAAKLIEMANASGGKDNITVILIRVTSPSALALELDA